MFFESSATRVDSASACRSLAIFSSAGDLLWTAPFESVSLSGVLALATLSSTLACNLPPAWRSAAATCAVGAPSASLRRKLLKSFACAVMVLVASAADVAPAVSSVGKSSSAPDFKRLMLPPMKASGLLFSSATSIWSSEMPAGLFWPAILLAVSPLLTVTC